MRAAIGVHLPPNERAWYDPYLAAVRAHLPVEAFAAAWAAGQALPLEQAVREALADGPMG